MKNKLLNHSLFKTIMNFTLIQLLLLAMMTGVSIAGPSSSDDLEILEQKLTVNVKNQPLKNVLSTIEDLTEARFAYSVEAIGLDEKISIIARNEKLATVLAKLFEPRQIVYQVVGVQIILNQESEKKELGQIKPEEVRVAISGKVTSENGESLPGVTVLVKGTLNGSVTDLDGNYNIEVPNEDDVLVFSSIGYLSQEVPINGRSVIDVVLLEDVQGLDEVVVVAYGRQDKRDLTGSIATIKTEEITEMPSANFINGLQGRASGLQVTGSSGVPGAPAKVLIRGVNSISSNADPLYVIDGMPMFSSLNGLGESNNTTPQNPMASINPNDIESIEVLKDAAATAVYGSRGANGVILITTKSGQTGKGGVTINISTGISELTRTAEDIGFANSQEWFQLMDEARINSGFENYDPMRNVNLFPTDNETAVDPISREQALSTNTDWFDQILRQGSFKDVGLSASRGMEKLNFYTSFNYREDVGVLKNNDFRRLTGRVNLDFEPIKNLRTGVRVNVSYTDNDRVKSMGSNGGFGTSTAAGGWSQANFSALPWYPVYQFDDPTKYWNPLSINNLAARIDPRYINDNLETFRGIGGVWAEYFLPWVAGLSIRTEGSFDLMQGNSINWVSREIMVNPSTSQDGSYASEQATTSKNYNYNLYANYITTIADIHNFNISAGTESLRSTGFNRFMAGSNLSGTRQWLGNPGLFQAISTGISGEKYIRGYFTRANYKLMDKYLLGLSFRRDGSSTFSPELRWGNFLAVSAGWILSEEIFMQNLPFISFLKLRGSFGQTGNESIPGNLDVTGFAGDRRYGLQEAGGGVGTRVTNLPSLDITWETTESYDFGLDFGIINDRVSGSAVYFQRDVTDLLLQIPLPPSVQPSSVWGNAGDMQNKGWELNLNTVNISTDNFTWSTNFNFTTVSNKVLRLTPQADASGKGIINGQTVTRTGDRLGTWFMPDYAGVDPEKGIELLYEIDRDRYDATGETIKTGNLIPATNNNLTNHRYFHEGKTTLPTYFGGFENTFTYKGFDLSVLFSFSGGNYLYDNNEKMNSYAGTGGLLLRKAMLGNTWTPENPDATYPQLRFDHIYLYDNEGNPSAGTSYSNQNLYHSKYLYKGDYIRLRSLQVGYTLPAPVVEKLKMQGIRVFVSGANLFTWTDFPGWDPEVVTNTGGGQSANLTQGFIGNNLPLPQLKTYTLGISANF
jgi:TonB-linked SusC/RagA family outer membrane protein